MCRDQAGKGCLDDSLESGKNRRRQGAWLDLLFSCHFGYSGLR